MSNIIAVVCTIILLKQPLQTCIILSSFQKVEPGLGESETFYSLTYVTMFAAYTISAVTCGFAFNYIPTWYLFMASTLCHTFGYILYAMAVTGWMMIVSRGLTGLSLGAVESLAFSYLGVSFEKYVDNLKILGRYDKKRAVKQKGFLFSSYNIGKMSGFSTGIGILTSGIRVKKGLYRSLRTCYKPID